MAITKTLEAKGKIILKQEESLNLYGDYGIYYLNETNIGALRQIEPKGEIAKKAVVNFGNGLKQSWTYGVMDERPEIMGRFITFPPTPLILNLQDDSVNFANFYKTFTSYLPEGFYVYMPSFPWVVYNTEDGKRKVQNTTEATPAIYTQGEKFTFTKPK